MAGDSRLRSLHFSGRWDKPTLLLFEFGLRLEREVQMLVYVSVLRIKSDRLLVGGNGSVPVTLHRQSNAQIEMRRRTLGAEPDEILEGGNRPFPIFLIGEGNSQILV